MKISNRTVGRRARTGLALALLATAGAGAADADARPRDDRAGCKVGLAPMGTAGSWAGMAYGSVSAYTSPGGRLLARFDRLNINGYPTLFGVRGRIVDGWCRTRWYRVQVPMRPNGAHAFVRAREIWKMRVRTRIEVDLSARELRFFRGGRLRIRARAAIGAPGTPTPTGRFYVNQLLIPVDKTGPYGPGAIGISAFSEVLTGWTQGGPVAIHGTNDPSSIGRDVSNGCIRLSNPVLRRLFAATPAGTPVLIRA